MSLSRLLYLHVVRRAYLWAVRPVWVRVALFWLRRDRVVVACDQCAELNRATVMREAFLLEGELEAMVCPKCWAGLKEVEYD